MFSALTLLSLAASFKSDYEQCQNANDYGLPRFESKTDLLKSPWADYFKESMGSLPSSFPFCVFDLWFLNQAVPSFSKLGLKPDPSKAAHGNNISHVWHKGDYKNGDLFETDFGFWIYHEDVAVVQNDTWIEIEHALFETETKAMWFTRARGSGIWRERGPR